MADNVGVRPSTTTGSVQVATDEISSVHYPIYKTGFGADGSITQVDASNPLPVFTVQPRDFFFEVAAGNISGHTSQNIVSHAAGITTAAVGIKTVWEEPALYTYSSTADIDTITSTNNSDTHDITIVGLDASYTQIVQTVTLTGQTAKALTTPLMRINLIYNDTSTATLGTIYVWISGGGSTAGVPTVQTDIRGLVSRVSGLSNEKSTSSVYTIPAGKNGYIVFGKTSATDNQAVELTFWARPFGKVFLIAHHIDFKNSNYDYFFKVPGAIPEKADIEVRATTDAGTSEVSANYDIILVDA